MKFSGKICLKIILKVTKNQGFTLSLEDTFIEKLDPRFLLIGRYELFYHNDMIKLFYQNLTFPVGVNNCLHIFSRKNIVHGLLFSFSF